LTLYLQNAAYFASIFHIPREVAMSESAKHYHTIEACRVGASRNLISVLNLGHLALTGVFPKSPKTAITCGPLELVWCPESGLLQLAHSFDAHEMYGENYGYRSGLNQSMVQHLARKIHNLEHMADLKPGDTVLDIGSNDATSLKAYTVSGLTRIGMDPTGAKFKQYYSHDIALVSDFFSANGFWTTARKKAKVVTSIAMFYDLEEPVKFAREVAEVLADDGIWHLEQSYMPSMLRLCSYDTVCHEHLEYYSLAVIRGILDAADMKIVDVQMNSVNGGSFAVTSTHRKNNSIRSNNATVCWLLEQEERMGLGTPRPYRDFEERVYRHRADLTRLLRMLVADGQKVLGYGASTKGNVLLQFCGFTEKDIPAIAEINPDKFGAFTPGTFIPIVSEAEARAMQPNYFLVLPWHFKESILAREQEFLARGGRMIFPFPEIEIV
jgi:C-methyltransferase-like protein/putative zinc binding protein/methyltransferase family protein